MSRSLKYSQWLAGACVAGFFLLLAWFRIADVYHAHFFDHGGVIAAYQVARFLYIPCIVWLQYAVGAYVLYRMGRRAFPFVGLSHFIASFLLGTSLWHIVLFAVGVAGLYFYVPMLLLAGGVMIASLPHLAHVIEAAWQGGARRLTLGEKWLAVFAMLGALAFILIKGIYLAGGHDYFNHYSVYYRQVLESGSIGPHSTWYHYYYSKGLGLYFLSMILLDPFGLYMVAVSFVIVSACMLFDYLRAPGRSLVLPLFGVFLFFIMYVHTPGRMLFAANGGWGDLEKIHELSAMFAFATLWLVKKMMESRSGKYGVILCILSLTIVIVQFASGVLSILFFGVLFLLFAARRDWWAARIMFAGAGVTAVAMVGMLVFNWATTGLTHDQLNYVLWRFVNWRKVVETGFTLELYSDLSDKMRYVREALPFWKSLPLMIVEYYRIYMLKPFLVLGVLLLLSSRRIPQVPRFPLLPAFLFAGLLYAMFLGGREQPISFFRFSTFNYAPMIVACLLLWRYASERMVKAAIALCLLAGLPWMLWQAPNAMHGWARLTRAAYFLNTGQYSLRDAISDQSGQAGRLEWGGQYPAMEEIYSMLPAGTMVWSIHNHSYCMLSACNVHQYFSQVTSPRWYDIALGSVEEGKKIMQEEGINFIFYSRSVPVVFAADTKDQLSAFYKGLDPKNIDKVFGILWTNGWDYLLTWKENSLAPLDANFMESWQLYQQTLIAKRRKQFPVERLAQMVKQAAEDPSVTKAPEPEW